MNYFRPLRRRLGVGTLMVACVFAAAWVRSHIVHDQVLIIHPFRDDGVSQNSITSADGCISWVQRNEAPFKAQRCGQEYSWRTFDTVGTVPNRLVEMQLVKQEVRWPDAGLYIGTSGNVEGRSGEVLNIVGVKFPYCPIVLFLTALSAYLLLRKWEPSLNAERVRRTNTLAASGETVSKSDSPLS